MPVFVGHDEELWLIFDEINLGVEFYKSAGIPQKPNCSLHKIDKFVNVLPRN